MTSSTPRPFRFGVTTTGIASRAAWQDRAITENWLAEIDGLNLTLTFLRSKRRQAQRGAVLRRDRPTDLGMPAPPHAR
jgi:hypothetical protein